MIREPIRVTPYWLAGRFMDIKEVPGEKDNPQIVAFLRTVGQWWDHDEVPWCSAFVNWIMKVLGIVRSYNAGARSWLLIGVPVAEADAEVGWDVVVLKRGDGNQPGPEVINAPGHVGLFGGWSGDNVIVRSGNQGNKVSDAMFPRSLILGIRRVA